MSRPFLLRNNVVMRSGLTPANQHAGQQAR
eukprot:SAG25_NODE_14649_length_252_cov_0.738562_1_plen_29_part_10